MDDGTIKLLSAIMTIGSAVGGMVLRPPLKAAQPARPVATAAEGAEARRLASRQHFACLPAAYNPALCACCFRGVGCRWVMRILSRSGAFVDCQAVLGTGTPLQITSKTPSVRMNTAGATGLSMWGTGSTCQL